MSSEDDESWDEHVRVAVYRAFAAYGRQPTAPELADAAGGSLAVAKQALHRLADAHHLVLDDCEHVVLAHPFAAVPLGFSVMGEHTLWWGGCAWDSFAIPHLVPHEPEVLVATRCPGCGEPHALVVGRDAPPAGEQVAHFLVPAARMWDDVLRTCGNQRLFCAESCVDGWLAETGHAKGYVMDLATLWRLAKGWYAGRLEYGYRRREPARAAEYFAEAGLRGAFWER
ncbi:organomercurial lyase [Amycolatopsis sp. NPDC059027]|uniref:organomercurial lyase n=1 Tax=unclassified Amycolatopsis TaxID=2618356 RepID=UPI0036708F04